MKTLTKTQRVLFALTGACLAAAAFFQFCMVGYLMTALMCLGGAACFAFFGVLAPRTTPAARRARIAAAILLVVGFGLFLAAEVPVLRDARSDADADAPYLLVCGAGIDGTEPSLSMLDRLHEARDWLAAHPDGVAVLSGSQAPDEITSEAQVMYDWLTAQGVDPAQLLLETADNSLENIQNTLALIASRGDDPAGRLAILSSEYHLHRLKYMAEKLGCDPVLVAARTTKISLFVNYAVREAFAMWKLWLFGM